MAPRGWNRTPKVDRVAAPMGQPRTGTENRRAPAVATNPRESVRASIADQAAPTCEDGAPPAAARGRAASLRESVGHAPLVLAGLAVAIAGSTPLAVAWFVACRSAYVLFVGFSLRAQSKHGALSKKHGEQAWPRFRARASRIMVGDAIAFGALCVVTRGTLALAGP